MALFNRGDKTNVPEEIQEYYQTERRERAGIAWLLAIGTLVATIVLAAGIFFAGRWAYRKIAGNDTPPTTEVVQNEDQGQDQKPESETPAPAPAEEQDQSEEGQQSADSSEGEDSEADQETAAPTTPTGGSGGGDQQIAAAGDSIPDTGPGDTLAIFLAVSVLGYVLHRYYSNKATE